MIKKIPFLFALLIPFFTQAQYSLNEENESNYTLKSKDLMNNKIQIYNICYDISFKSISPKGVEFQKDKWMYDILRSSEDQKEDFYLLMSRGTAILPRKVFTKEEILSEKFQNSNVEGYEVTKKDKLYEAKGSKFNPSYEFIINVFDPNEKVMQEHVESMIQSLGELKWEDKTLQPTRTVVKEGSNFDRVMMQKTNYLTRQISFYYALDENTTLVQYYVLSYVYSLPPAFVGGAKMMIDKVNEGVLYGINASANL
ncbi:hypothetical protein [Flammeovirga pacifica]|uniref:DUF3298 domain-containing protein n=1 Tax=Flammeovirga pacifica TaxID=915059 RepID=A0A1S1Z430_FLAPC|nr:hypothetical protein [Flammeovirga pacifica]OHX68030.1 hypothetical protein NH26_17620 [Flammeovirga pacifica]